MRSYLLVMCPFQNFLVCHQFEQYGRSFFSITNFCCNFFLRHHRVLFEQRKHFFNIDQTNTTLIHRGKEGKIKNPNRRGRNQCRSIRWRWFRWRRWSKIEWCAVFVGSQYRWRRERIREGVIHRCWRQYTSVERCIRTFACIFRIYFFITNVIGLFHAR